MHRSKLLAAVLLLSAHACHALATKPKTYNYFAFGSNMASSTMINLRSITPLASSAAVLPGHALRFNIPGMPGVEPSSAAVEPAAEQDVVHGVLYSLSEGDFATICSTEGVPFAYSLHRCRVVPYTGDGKSAGKEALDRAAKASGQSTSNNNLGVPAFTLRASRRQWRQGMDIPPSQSYLNVLLRGAKEFALDQSYVEKLESIPVGRTFVGDGWRRECCVQQSSGRAGTESPKEECCTALRWLAIEVLDSH
ncbi:hypothetical protein ACHAXT_008931 [Thalassiosira profunda]